MNEKNVELFIDIYYEGRKNTVQLKDIISFENLIEKCMKNFKIKNEKKENIIFTFKDEQGDTIKLSEIESILYFFERNQIQIQE